MMNNNIEKKYCKECEAELIKIDEKVSIDRGVKYCNYKCSGCGRLIVDNPETLTKEEAVKICNEMDPEEYRVLREKYKTNLTSPYERMISRLIRREFNPETCEHEFGEYDRDGDFKCEDCNRLIYVENKEINKKGLGIDILYKNALNEMEKWIDDDSEYIEEGARDAAVEILTDFIRDLGYDKLVYLFKKVY